MKIVISGLLALALLTSTSHASDVKGEAFGVVEGTTIAQLKKEYKAIKGENLYIINKGKIKKPFPLFDLYAVTATEKTGVCEVFAQSKYKYSYPELLVDVDRMKAILTKKYGDPDIEDVVPPLYPDTSFYELMRGSAKIKYLWAPARSSGMQGVILRLRSHNGVEGYVSLHYAFNNFTECSKILDAQEQNGL